MPKAHLVFIKYKNSYNVRVTNLEKLSVEQIQELEAFAKNRKSMFDFESHSFSIQKKVEYYQFESLVKHSKIDATTEEHVIIKEASDRIGFGQYKGMAYNELPDSYMLWLKGSYRGYDREKVDKELKRRAL